jgi:hypothetical protein
MSIAPMMPDSGVLYIGIRKSIELKTMTRVKIIETVSDKRECHTNKKIDTCQNYLLFL